MNITPRFVLAIKLSLLVVIILSIYSFVLSYYGMEGWSISNPSENSSLRSALNQIKIFLVNISLWLLIGYIVKDYKATFIAITTYIIVHVASETISCGAYSIGTPKDIKYYLVFLGEILPTLAFALAHFKSSQGLKLIIYWLITWGLAHTLDSSVFERLINGLIRILGLRTSFEIQSHIAENSYRSISIFQILSNELFLIVKLSVFWWVYQLIKSNKTIWDAMQTCYSSIGIDRISYSIIYWSFRLFLSVAGLGILSYIVYSFIFPLEIIMIFKVVLATCSLVIVASIYRNFLVSNLSLQNIYPRGLFILLNLPFFNIIGWVYTLVNFNDSSKESINDLETKVQFSKLQANFIKEGRNRAWKITLVILSLIGLLYLPIKRIIYSGLGGDGVVWILLSALIYLGLLIWFLNNKNSYKVILIILCANIGLVTVVRDESIVNPVMAVYIINIVLFFAMFYFDELKWDSEVLSIDKKIEEVKK